MLPSLDVSWGIPPTAWGRCVLKLHFLHCETPAQPLAIALFP